MGTTILRSLLFVAAAASVAIAVEPGRLDSWIVTRGAHNESMAGSSRDLERVRRLAGNTPVLWARQDGAEWLVRDGKLVARAQALLAPLDALSEQMKPLGDKQGVLGKQQTAMGKQMRELSRDPERNSGAMTALGDKMSALGEKQEAIGRQQEAIGAKMEAVSAQLGPKLSAILDDARAAGLAQPVH
jgi:hypothetical protein